ncbi:hypothetical protein WMY93_032332 [Mugilogobius chulae]|uniref:Uncharacterized protein n=1 Tax=Mugilogobius chulae TaxID=88201 RepID=A0AAW0MPH8_9GOBI
MDWTSWKSPALLLWGFCRRRDGGEDDCFIVSHTFEELDDTAGPSAFQVEGGDLLFNLLESRTETRGSQKRKTASIFKKRLNLYILKGSRISSEISHLHQKEACP